jgi:hypothetical protein
MPGVARKQTITKPKKEEEEVKEKIKFDVFADEDETANKYKTSAPILDNVRLFLLSYVLLGNQHDETLDHEGKEQEQAIRLQLVRVR